MLSDNFLTLVKKEMCLGLMKLDINTLGLSWFLLAHENVKNKEGHLT